MEDLEGHGGMVRAIEDGYVQKLIAEEAYRFQQRLESGEKVVVGVNRFQNPGEAPPDVEGYQLDEADRARQLGRLAEVKRERDGRQVARCLATLAQKARADDNLMPPLVEAVKAYCTVGEISDALRETWGEFQQPVVF
jgi:methylmalonyl-CoA mutase N-terminal domain/subunit